MKRFKPTILTVIMIVIALGFVFYPTEARADSNWLEWLACYLSPVKCAAGVASGMFIDSFVAMVGNFVIMVASWFVGLCGLVLNISIVLTMNIRAIYDATPAIQDVWLVIRNLSSMFIIFSLLYASIMTILDASKTSVKELIGKIIVVGLLINFSLFFTKVAIDASNLISLQIYRAIVPSAKNLDLEKGSLATILTTSFSGDGGLSGLFMSSLKVNNIYDQRTVTNGLLQYTNGSTWFKIAVATILGSCLMILAALSFLAAGIAFIVRLVVLLLLLGFSPVYFAGMIFPEIESKVSKKWLGYLEKELLFMPAYLLMMYVALRFISTIGASGGQEGFFALLSQAQMNAGKQTASNGIFLSTVGLLLQYTIAFILINAPLMAASQIGGYGVGMGEKASKWLGGTIKKSAWTNTGGRVASKLANNESFKNFASKSIVGELALKGTRSVAQNYNTKLDKQVKARTEFAESLGYDKSKVQMLESNVRYINRLKAQYGNGQLPADIISQLQNTYGQGVTTLKAAGDRAEERVAAEKNRRKDDYAEYTNKPGVQTLWTKVARKDKVAAAKIKRGILSNELTEVKDALKDVKSDMKNLNQRVTNVGGWEINGQPNPQVNDAQREQLRALKARESNLLSEISRVQSEIDQAELTS